MKAKSLKLPFGLLDGHLVSPDQVERGLACRCTCPGCGSPLIANHGEIRTTQYFSHKYEDCKHAIESALHLASKEAILSSKRIILPPLILGLGGYSSIWKISDSINFIPEHVDSEKRFDNIIPDIVIKSGSRRLFIEIYVTHKVDRLKLNKIKKMNESTLEIDLSKLENPISFTRIQELVVDSLDNKKWIYNAKLELIRNQVLLKALQFKTIQRGLALHVDDCPISARIWKKKPYANVIDDCVQCQYCAHVSNSNEGSIDKIYCLGGLKISSYDQWLQHTRA